MVSLFLLAVVVVVSAVDAMVGFVYLWGIKVHVPQGSPLPGLGQLLALVPGRVYAWGAVLTAGVIFAVSIIKIARLGEGGAAVAKMAGGRRVNPSSADPLERRLLNVVEEMAIASGVRVPAAYVMDAERGINAFAAGWDASTAVIAVTRGALETLTRDELQGVIGHEFSHILNGDIRLNIRMIGVLAGIVFIGSIGGFLLRNTRGSRDERGAAAVLLFGLALFIIGYIGLFFARLIKAKVSREREFLADASSVQFTRNPDGLAGALDQIRESDRGALISSRAAEELSHTFFGEAVPLGGLFETHPPLEERIRRVRPGFQSTAYLKRRAASAAAERAVFAPAAAPAPQRDGRRSDDLGIAWGRSAADSAKMVGVLESAKVDYAVRLLSALPQPLRESLRDPQAACAALVGLVLAGAEEVKRLQLDAARAAGGGALAERAAAMAAQTQGLGPAFQLPLVDLALAAAKSAPQAAKDGVLAALQAAIHADRRVSVHEFVILFLVRDQLGARARSPAGSRKLAEMAPQASLVLSVLAHAGIRTDAAGTRAEALAAAMTAGAREMGIDAAPPAAPLTLDAASDALEALKRLAPLQKALLVKGLFAAVIADGTIRVAEAELMRLVGAALDCPLPPLLAEMDPAALAQ